LLGTNTQAYGRLQKIKWYEYDSQHLLFFIAYAWAQ